MTFCRPAPAAISAIDGTCRADASAIMMLSLLMAIVGGILTNRDK
jgi:hypothetical protein